MSKETEKVIKKYIGDILNEGDSSDNKVIVIRTGEAPKLNDEKIPNPVNIIGTISAPSSFYKKRSNLHDPNKCHVIYNKYIGSITLVIDEQFNQYVITGVINSNPDLKQFEINTKKMFGIKELMGIIKFNRLFFVDKEQNAKIVLSLQNFKAKVEKILSDKTDLRGNEEQFKIIKLEHELEASFQLKMPIHKGGMDQIFNVDICVSATSNDVSVWLESRDLNELQNSCKQSIIEAELENFKDIACIEQ